jgi:hypothetical protein
MPHPHRRGRDEVGRWAARLAQGLRDGRPEAYVQCAQAAARTLRERLLLNLVPEPEAERLALDAARMVLRGLPDRMGDRGFDLWDWIEECAVRAAGGPR